MDNREFIDLAKRETISYVVPNLVQSLRNPPGLLPENESATAIGKSMTNFINAARLREQRQSTWFNALSVDGKKILEELLQECAERTVFSFLTLIDGVGGSYEGVFEIVHVDQDDRTVINPQNTEMLHDLFSEACAIDRGVDPSSNR